MTYHSKAAKKRAQQKRERQQIISLVFIVVGGFVGIAMGLWLVHEFL